MASLKNNAILQVKPKSAQTKAGYLSVGVELYGGGLWHTWWAHYLVYVTWFVR